MICPKCHAEFREGFSRCVDCELELVEASPESLVAAAREEPEANAEDPFCEFWRGEDARIRAELCELLTGLNVPFRTVEWQDHLFNRFRSPVFRIAIPFSQFEKAEKAVEEAYGGAEEADDALHPTEENRPASRKLLEWPLEQKLEGVPAEEQQTFWEHVSWKRKRQKSEGIE